MRASNLDRGPQPPSGPTSGPISGPISGPPSTHPNAPAIASGMTTKRPTRPHKAAFVVDWPVFGELSRALALKVAREFDPELVIGIANAGVVPGAVVAAILDRPFHSMMVSRRYRAETVRATPSVFGEAPSDVRGKRVLIVDETCDSGDTLRLAIAAILNSGAAEIRTAVSFKTGSFVPDFHAMELENSIVLPWDREILVDGELSPNPKYEGLD